MKKKLHLICFDLNKTLIEENTWARLNARLGISHKEDERLHKLYKKGKITYQQWQEALMNHYKKSPNATRASIENIILNYHFKKGAQEIISYLKQKGYQISLISGSIDILVKRVAQELEIDLFAANNTLIFDKDHQLTSIQVAGDEAKAKLAFLKGFCGVPRAKARGSSIASSGETLRSYPLHLTRPRPKRRSFLDSASQHIQDIAKEGKKLHITLTQCACIGDGESDILLFEQTGHGITFKGAKIAHKAWKTINTLADIKQFL